MEAFNDLKASFARRSNDCWRDAHAPEEVLSARTRAKCAFDAGYFALLANASKEARARVSQHADPDFVRAECSRGALPADTGVRFLATEDSPFDDDRPTVAELLAWATTLRSQLL